MNRQLETHTAKYEERQASPRRVGEVARQIVARRAYHI
jgi:hypothetical protein